MSALAVIRRGLKATFDVVGIALMSPLSACCALERRVAPRSERKRFWNEP